MNPVASPPDPAIREIPLSRLALAPENVRKTPPDDAAQAQLRASIAAHGLLENLVVRPDGAREDGAERFAVVAGGRRLAALQALAEDGAIDPGRPVPCLVAAGGDAGELSLAENAVRIAMHPADQVTAFGELARSGATVAAIAARFGIGERTVEQRLRLGNAAAELLDAYRADEIDLETLKAFAVTADRERQLAVWAQVSGQGYRPSAWQVKRLLTEERVPAGSDVARFVGVEAYEAAGGAVLRDLFADRHEDGVWLEDAGLLTDLAMRKLRAAADELATRWKWAEAMVEVDWTAAARCGRIQPEPGEPTPEEETETGRLRTRFDELAALDEEDWSEELEAEADSVEARLEEIEAAVRGRATFRREDFSIAGCIVAVGRGGTLEVIHGLVKPEDMPKPAPAKANGRDVHAGDGTTLARAGHPETEARMAAPVASPPDPKARAREEAGVGIGLADDLRAIRTALVKAHLARDFEAAFDLALFQLARSVFGPPFTPGYHALDIAVVETPDRPAARTNDPDFAAWSPGEAMLADRPHLSLEWMDEYDAASFAALRGLPRADKKALFAAAVARTVKGQLAFEHDARAELEATVARLDIDFAKHVRPTADLLWSRLKKERILAVARETLGSSWAAARSRYRKADLAKAMEEAFAAGDPPLGVNASTHAAALAWTVPGFAPFDAGGADADGTPAATDAAAGGPPGSADAATPADGPRTTSAVESIVSPGAEPGDARAPEGRANGNGHDAPVETDEAHPAPANGSGGNRDNPAGPSIADAIDAINRVPAADDGPRVVVHRVGPVDGEDDPLEIPAFLRRID